MAESGWKTADGKGKLTAMEIIEKKKEEKRLRSEGKINYIRFERMIKTNETFDLATAAEDVITEIVNKNNDVKLLPIKNEGKELDYLEKFTSTKQAEKYFNPIKVELKNAIRSWLVSLTGPLA